MDNTKNLTESDIKDLIDCLDSYQQPEDTLGIIADGFDSILLSDYDYNNMMVQPLTTSQLASLNTITIAPSNTGILGPITGTNNATLSWQNLTQNGIYGIDSGQNAGLNVNGDANFEGDIKFKGKSLSESLENIEKRLALLHPNKDLEDKWEELKELGEKYRELEAEIISREEMFKTLKH